MLFNTAINLIKTPVIDQDNISAWADLGCGSGLFTKALSTLLADGSIIYAIDKSKQHIFSNNKAKIQFLQLDFINTSFDFSLLDGILMANSLHYVKDKKLFLKKISSSLKPNGKLLIVEYDTMNANRWVPFPINFYNLQTMLVDNNFKSADKISQAPSAFGYANIYSCIATKNN